jgi:dienelactone hydrolase
VSGGGPPRATPLSRERIEIPREGHSPIHVRIVHPRDDARGTAILCPGDAATAWPGVLALLAEQLAERGVRGVTFDGAPGGEAAMRDLELVEEESARLGWLGGRVGLFGHARGGEVAIRRAAREARPAAPAVSALVTWSVAATPETLDPAARVRAPWLVVHGSADETVPFADAERLAAAAPDDVARLARIGGAGHAMDAREPLPAPLPPRLDRAVAMTAHFLRAHLATGAAR